MKKIEISAFSREEAEEIAFAQGLKILGNVTSSWKKQGCPLNGRDFEIFGSEELTDAKINKIKGVGLIVEIVPGKKNNRTHPYTYENVPINKGLRVRERIFELRIKDTNELIGWELTKPKAYILAKKLMPSIRKHMYCVIAYRIKDDRGICFNLKYKPSYGTVKGKYIAFGNETAN